MCTLYERISDLCKTKGVSVSRMCLDLGLSKSTMSGMKNGRTKGLSIPTAQKIAGYFDITVDELYSGSSEEEEKEIPTTPEGDGYTDEERELIEWFRNKASRNHKAIIRLMYEETK